MNFSEYRKRISVDGETQRDRIISRDQRLITKLSPSNPAYKAVTIDGVPTNIIIVSTQVTSTKTIEALPGQTFGIGSIVLWNGSHWLITERDLEDAVTLRGRIEQCNRQVTWQNPITSEIHSRWCTVSKPYFSDLSEEKIYSESKREYKMQLPYDDETSLLDVGKRFMLENINGKPRTYRVTCVDTMTERYDSDGSIKGFLVVNYEQDQYNESTDNAELGICDYVVAPIEGGNPTKTLITYSGAAEVKIGGSPKKFSVLYQDADGNPASDSLPVWNLLIAPELTPYVSVAKSAQSITVRACNSSLLMGAMGRIEVRDESGVYTPATLNIKFVQGV